MSVLAAENFILTFANLLVRSKCQRRKKKEEEKEDKKLQWLK